MLIVVMLLLGLPLALAMAPLFIASNRFRRERERLLQWALIGGGAAIVGFYILMRRRSDRP